MELSELKLSCQNCRLHELCLPQGLHSRELEQLERIVERPRPLRRGAILYRAGDAFHSLYAVRSGAMKIYTGSRSGDEQILGFYVPGELVGLDGMEKDRHQGTAVALETGALCVLPFNDLNKLCEQVPGLQKQLLRLIGREIAAEHQLLLMIGQKSAEERLAIFLLTFAARYKRLGYSATEFRLPMSRHDLANYLGLTPETVSRLFRRFQESGLLDTNRSFVKIRNLSRLAAQCAAPEHSTPLAAMIA